jgi:hypothetical protein
VAQGLRKQGFQTLLVESLAVSEFETSTVHDPMFEIVANTVKQLISWCYDCKRPAGHAANPYIILAHTGATVQDTSCQIHFGSDRLYQAMHEGRSSSFAAVQFGAWIH